MYTGIDLGSRYIKIVRLDENQEILEKRIFDSMDFFRNYGKLVDKIFYLNTNKLNIKESDKVTATGYGKHSINIKGVTKISEQRAHMLGAYQQLKMRDFILLDIGGQDTKILEVKGLEIQDIIMNDKCGASSGRYLENIANVLQITLDELSSYWQEPVEISNTCAVFGESEVLGKVFEGVSLSSIIAGANYSVYKRIGSQLNGIMEKTVIFTGGVAKNQAIRNILREKSGKNIIVPAEPQFNGAIGAAVFI